MHDTKGSTLKWIRPFLIGRTQTVVLEGEISEELSVASGVPQGSVLGSILFLLYTNDLPENIHSKVRLFADDTAVYLALGKQDGPRQLQGDLNQLQKWEKLWDMELIPVNVWLCTSPGLDTLLSVNVSCTTRS